MGEDHPRWAYFPFRDYEYRLDVTRQTALLPETKSLDVGLREEYEWFCAHREEVHRKNYIAYIDEHLMS